MRRTVPPLLFWASLALILLSLVTAWYLAYIRLERRPAGAGDNPLLAEPDDAGLPGETMPPEMSAPLGPEDFAPQ